MDVTPYFPSNITDYPKWVAKYGLRYEYGKCQCGCNASSNIATQRDHRSGTKKGQYMRFLRNHNRRIHFDLPSPNPSGLCLCGCGQRTSIAKVTDMQCGNVQGQPRRYLIGHHKRKDDIDSFWVNVNRRGPNDCWLWQGRKMDGGYGAARWLRKTHHASRISYIIHFGDIPDGLLVCHNCPGGDNPACVNPAHLWLGTQQNNMDDMRQKGRHPHGETHGCAKLTDSQVTEIRQRFAKENIAQRRLAIEYKVSPRTIANIINRLVWAHVP